MAELEIRAYAAGRGFHPQTLERWLSWDAADRGALERLAFGLKISENHLRDLMDWSEEIALREHVAVHTILASKIIADIETNPRLGRADRLKRIKEQIRRLRFPRLADTEDTIRAKIQALTLHPEVHLSVSPGLEGGNLRVEFSAASREDVQRLAEKLKQAANDKAMADIFDLLSGHLPRRDRS